LERMTVLFSINVYLYNFIYYAFLCMFVDCCERVSVDMFCTQHDNLWIYEML
jgi:hypothetical protein